MARRGETGWPVAVVDWPPTVENVERALRDGQYGRCVWACDNDVVDHQVVTLRYADGPVATLTMSAFTRMREGEPRIFGTRGELVGDGAAVEVYDFRTRGTTRHEVDADATGGPALVPKSPAETLASHRIAFAAETARREQRVVALDRP